MTPSIPIHLGPIPKLQRRNAPTVEELHQLARKADTASVHRPGTLHEVVEAWATMDANEYRDHPLLIGVEKALI